MDNNADYYGNLVTINNEDAILFSYDNRRYSDSREPISLGYNKRAVSTIDALSATLNITRNSIPNIWSSVYRSITFSIVDVMKKDGIDKKWNFENLSFNFFFEIQNFLGQPNPSPEEYGLNRDMNGEIILPRSLVPVSTNEGNSSPLPSFGFVLYF